MDDIQHRRFSEVLSELIGSAQEVTSLAQSSEIERQVFSEFAILVDKFVPILNDLRDNIKIMEHPPVQKAVESLGKEFDRTKAIITTPNPKTLLKLVEDMVHDLGRSLGLVLFASLEVSTDFKDKIGALHRDLMNVRFDMSSVASSSRHSEIVSELEVEEEIQEEKISVGIDDVVLKLKSGSDEELRLALLFLSELIGVKKVDNGWIEDEEVIPVLFNRLSSSKPEHRLSILHLLRNLALDNAENKVKKHVFFVCANLFLL